MSSVKTITLNGDWKAIPVNDIATLLYHKQSGRMFIGTPVIKMHLTFTNVRLVKTMVDSIFKYERKSTSIDGHVIKCVLSSGSIIRLRVKEQIPVNNKWTIVYSRYEKTPSELLKEYRTPVDPYRAAVGMQELTNILKGL